MSVFRELWFTLPPEGVNHREVLIRRVTNITAVVRDLFSYWLCSMILPCSCNYWEGSSPRILVSCCLYPCFWKWEIVFMVLSRLAHAKNMSGLNSSLNRLVMSAYIEYKPYIHCWISNLDNQEWEVNTIGCIAITLMSLPISPPLTRCWRVVTRGQWKV